MVLKKFQNYKNEITRKSSFYLEIGKDIFDYGRELIRDRLLHQRTQGIKESSVSTHEADNNVVELRRKNLQSNLVVPEADNPEIAAKEQSMKMSQGIPDHSGSSYHGPGKPGEKTNSNMWQRNFDNHQGN